MTVDYARDYVESAEELAQELVRLLKVRQLYDPNHPQRSDAESRATTRIGQLLDAHGTIEFHVDEEALLVGDEVVFRQEAGRESLPHLLFREGIRHVAFYAGLTVEELAAFAENVARAARVEEEEGLLGRLWEEQFYHLRYRFVERLLDEEWVPPAATDGEREEERGAVELAPDDAADLDEARRRISEFEETLYFLDEEDIAALRLELETEKERTLIHECFTCLRELLVHPVHDDTGPILEALEEMQARLLEDGEYADVQRLHQLFVPYLEGPSADQRGRDAFARMRSAALDEAALAGLAARLDAGGVEDRVAAAYYRVFGGEEPRRLLAGAGAGDVKKLCQSPAVASAFLEIARERMDDVAEVLRGDEPEPAATAAWLAGQLADPRMVEDLGRALGSDSALVRREAIQALKQLGAGRALEQVARAVEDPDPSVRLYALRHLVAHGYTPALPRVAELLEGEKWRERPAAERRLLFEAYGALGGERAVEPLVRRLRRRSGLLRKGDPEEMAYSVVGLAAAGTDEARRAVAREAESRHEEVRAAARVALASWQEPPSVEGAR